MPSRTEHLADGVTLYLGDCRDILPTLGKVDAVVTDPPYGINGGRGGDAANYKKGVYASEFEDTEDYIAQVCVPAITAALAMAKRGAITPGIRCLHMYPRPADIGCFYTPAAMTHGPWGFVGFNPVLYYGKDFRAGHGSLPSSITVTEASPKVDHPCPKPIRAWKWLVDKVSQPNETICDPFFGSGTTGIVAVKMGRRFVGIELCEKYFDIACQRISDTLKQPDMFVESPKPAKQESWNEMWGKPFDFSQGPKP